MPIDYDWKISRNRKTDVTTLRIIHPNGGAAVTGTGKDIWAAREDAISKTKDVEVLNFITAHVFHDPD